MKPGVSLTKANADLDTIAVALEKEYPKSNTTRRVYMKGLLESAVGRQCTSLTGVLKYPDPVDNAATLLYGICNDHPFHNGNKRTALVSMLVHLDRNQYTLFDTSQNELYDLMIAVAGHTLETKSAKREKAKHKRRRTADAEVLARDPAAESVLPHPARDLVPPVVVALAGEHALAAATV